MPACLLIVTWAGFAAFGRPLRRQRRRL